MNIIVELQGQGDEYVAMDSYDGTTVGELKKALVAQGVVGTAVDTLDVLLEGKVLEDEDLLEATPMGPDVRVEVRVQMGHVALAFLKERGIARVTVGDLKKAVDAREWEVVRWLLVSNELADVGFAWQSSKLLEEFAPQPAVVAQLLAMGAIDVYRDDFHPLATVCRMARLPAATRLDLVEMLLAARADARSVDDFGHPPLLALLQSVASPATAAEVAIVRALIAAGANVNRASSTCPGVAGPLEVAATRNDANVVDILLAAGAAPNGHPTRPALHHAAEGGHTRVVAMLLAAGADPGLRDKDAQLLPIDYAARRGHLAVVRALWSALSPSGFDGWSTLQQKNTRKGVRHDAISEANRTPLHWAAQNGHAAVAQYLVDNGAMINARDREYATPLYCAVHGTHVPIARALLAARACPNGGVATAVGAENVSMTSYATMLTVVPSAEALPLAIAVEQGCVELVNLLLAEGASPNLLDTSPRCRSWGGLAPLHIAVRGRDDGKRQAMVAALLAHGADPRMATGDGHTALHFHAMCVEGRSWGPEASDYDLLKLLLRCGADPTARTAGGLAMTDYLDAAHGRIARRLWLHSYSRRRKSGDCIVL